MIRKNFNPRVSFSRYLGFYNISTFLTRLILKKYWILKDISNDKNNKKTNSFNWGGESTCILLKLSRLPPLQCFLVINSFCILIMFDKERNINLILWTVIFFFISLDFIPNFVHAHIYIFSFICWLLVFMAYQPFRLFNAKSIFMKIGLFQTIQFSISTV